MGKLAVPCVVCGSEAADFSTLLCDACIEETERQAAVYSRGETLISPTLFDVGEYTVTKTTLEADAAALGVDPDGQAPMPFHTAIPMDGGDVRDADKVVEGFYRHYDAISVQSEHGTASMVLKADELDRRQIAWDVARKCPVTAQVVFRLVDGQVIAQLVSYVAFA